MVQGLIRLALIQDKFQWSISNDYAHDSPSSTIYTQLLSSNNRTISKSVSMISVGSVDASWMAVCLLTMNWIFLVCLALTRARTVLCRMYLSHFDGTDSGHPCSTNREKADSWQTGWVYLLGELAGCLAGLVLCLLGIEFCNYRVHQLAQWYHTCSSFVCLRQIKDFALGEAAWLVAFTVNPTPEA